MKKIVVFTILVVLLFASKSRSSAQQAAPDTVLTGVYINSIHNIDFKLKEFTISCWMWFRYKNKDFDFIQNIEIPNAKSVTKSFYTVDSSGGDVYQLMKLDCVIKDNWKIENFPFDKQSLRFFVENSQFDSSQMVFKADTAGNHFDARYTIRGWNIDSLKISNGIKTYQTDFGDIHAQDKQTKYSNFRVKLVLSRDAIGLFWKIFIGMYLAMLIAYLCFYIPADNIDSRFGLSVGALFAVVGNKYVVEASLPESTTFTLVDSLHGVTLMFIVLTIVGNAIALRLKLAGKMRTANRTDFIMAQVMLIIYTAVNAYLINDAIKA